MLKASNLVTQISAASKEQHSTLKEVNAAVQHMDENTQQNAALVEESAAASISLTNQSDSLIKMMGYFKLHAEDMEHELQADPEVKKIKKPDVKQPSKKQPASKKAHSDEPVQKKKTGTDDSWETF